MIRTCSPLEAAERLRAAGMSTSADCLRLGIQQGVFPFGDCVMSADGTKIYHVYVYVKALEQWIESHSD